MTTLMDLADRIIELNSAISNSNRDRHKMESDKANIQKENDQLRQLLWLYHGCQDLYGDDGEMQCSRCQLDFKRDSIQILAIHLGRRKLR